MRARVKCIRIDGSTPAHVRHNAVQSFQDDDTVRVAVGFRGVLS